MAHEIAIVFEKAMLTTNPQGIAFEDIAKFVTQVIPLITGEQPSREAVTRQLQAAMLH